MPSNCPPDPSKGSLSREPPHDARRALRDEIEAVAQVETFDRASGAFELAVDAARENDRGAVKPIFQPGCDDPDDALVPLRAIDAQRERVRGGRLRRALD